MKLKDLKDITSVEKPVTESSNENKNLSKAPPAGDVAPNMTTAQAAKELGVSQSRIRQMIGSGKFKTVKRPKKGRRDNMISADEVHKVSKKERPITGRPKGT